MPVRLADIRALAHWPARLQSETAPLRWLCRIKAPYYCVAFRIHSACIPHIATRMCGSLPCRLLTEPRRARHLRKPSTVCPLLPLPCLAAARTRRAAPHPAHFERKGSATLTSCLCSLRRSRLLESEWACACEQAGTACPIPPDIRACTGFGVNAHAHTHACTHAHGQNALGLVDVT